MENKTHAHEEVYQIHPIGYVHCPEGESYLEISEPFRPALKQLDQFSHVIVLWWGNLHDDPKSRSVMQCNPPYAQNKLTGIFACRAEYRPNPILVTVCKIISVDEDSGIVRLEYIDAIDGTPILDLKAYFPVCDRVREAKVPEWVSDWPEWVEDGHLLAI